MPTPNERHPAWLSSAQAAARLGVSRPTLYSYVSRGLLHPLPAAQVPGDGGANGAAPGAIGDGPRPHGTLRAKLYRRSEVERLARRNAAARGPRRAAQAALDFGLPVLESSLCLIEDGRFFYRGVDALDLAEHATLEEAAALLWGCDGGPALLRHPPPSLRAPPDEARPMPLRLRAGLERIVCGPDWTAPQPDDRAAHWSLVQAMALAATGRAPASPGTPLHEQLAAAWHVPAGRAGELRRALVLAADHELNASSFTARCVAGTGADAAAAMTAALAALSGPRHGAMSLALESLWPQLEAASRTTASLKRWLAGQGRVPGFGHTLYPQGDPRARALLAALPSDRARERLVQAVQRSTGHAPNLDFGLVALMRDLGAPPGAAFAVFAVARSIGWLAHVFEQRASGALIRPRAAYVGPRPQPTGAAPAAGRVIRRR